MTDDESAVTLDGVGRRFRRRDVLQDVSLSVGRGELFGIVGPDGAGKTTLLRMIAAVMNPSAGEIAVGGHSTTQDEEAVKAQIGYMPQQFGLYGDLSVAENLNFVAELHGVYGKERRDRMERLYDFTGLRDFAARKAALLSGGMKKKLALACVLMHYPDLLLLDEPTTGVDPVARRDFWDLLSGLHADGTTTIVSTPYMDEAERCSRVALLFEGNVLTCDTPANIKASIPGSVLALETHDIGGAKAAVRDLPFMLDVQTYGSQLNLIVTGDVETARADVRRRLEDAGQAIERLEPASMRMEEAFIYLVNQARGEVVA